MFEEEADPNADIGPKGGGIDSPNTIMQAGRSKLSRQYESPGRAAVAFELDLRCRRRFGKWTQIVVLSRK